MPVSPAVATLGGAGLGGLGGLVVEIGHFPSRIKKHGHHPVPVPEPATLFLMITAVLITLGARRVGRRMFFFEKKHQKTFAS